MWRMGYSQAVYHIRQKVRFPLAHSLSYRQQRNNGGYNLPFVDEEGVAQEEALHTGAKVMSGVEGWVLVSEAEQMHRRNYHSVWRGFSEA
jgi:hypothetical protein